MTHDTGFSLFLAAGRSFLSHKSIIKSNNLRSLRPKFKLPLTNCTRFIEKRFGSTFELRHSPL